MVRFVLKICFASSYLCRCSFLIMHFLIVLRHQLLQVAFTSVEQQTGK